MLYMTLAIQMTKPYLAITDDKQHYTCPADIDIVKHPISKGHYCSLSGGLYLIQESADCTLDLYFNKDLNNTYKQKTQLLSLAL